MVPSWTLCFFLIYMSALESDVASVRFMLFADDTSVLLDNNSIDILKMTMTEMQSEVCEWFSSKSVASQ